MSSRRFHFDGWTFHTDSGELTRDDRTIRLQDQPARLLQELLLHAGKVVTRDQLIAALWPKGVVDFDTGLNSAVRKVRVALQDTGNAPRYVETLPRKGYRFIGSIDPPPLQTPPESAAIIVEPPPVPTETPAPRPQRRALALLLAGTAVAAIIVGVIAWLRPSESTLPPRATVAVAVPKAVTAQPSPALLLVPFTETAAGAQKQPFAQAVTRFVYERLAYMDGLTVINGLAASRESNGAAESLRTRARWRLDGTIERNGDRLNVQTHLRDDTSGRILASDAFAGSPLELPALRRQIVAAVARLTGTTPRGSDAQTAMTRAQLNAYELYVEGEQLLGTFRVGDAAAAMESFKRATTLDPQLARGYLGIAQAAAQVRRLRKPDAIPTDDGLIEQSLDRALALDPQLGEVWTVRATMAPDDQSAEQLLRKALQLAPNDGTAYRELSETLWSGARAGEALEAIDRACVLEPRSARNHYLRGFYRLVATGDLDTFEQAMHDALAINPDFHPALARLAMGKWLFRGEFAEALLLFEHSIAVDPEADWGRNFAAIAYLDIDDPEAARDVIRDSKLQFAQLNIAQYEGQTEVAARLALEQLDGPWSEGPLAVTAEAIRDDGLKHDRLTAAASALGKRFSISTGNTGIDVTTVSSDVVYAHTLALAGETGRSQRLVQALLRKLDAEAVGRPPHFFSSERAAAFAVLGDRERTLDELEAAISLGYFAHWGYMAQSDPLYRSLHDSPRFQALAERARTHRQEQRAKVEEMRRQGKIPRRPAGH